MGAYLGVAQGSQEPPKFIHLTYTPVNGHASA
jgi:leucyl aminopeptidase